MSNEKIKSIDIILELKILYTIIYCIYRSLSKSIYLFAIKKKQEK